ncbi:hypothetical protein [Phenylobacterium sp.]|uniref:hypothetical protein n=1 Tax=Phenylobacterium sp. TaxID=1871053 RepID=UPI00120514C1|nr:hypothetical protein [Phenylobacterium sp.]THD64630.1 MAG: hypothetical protein E8A49_00830 [Phenylobacterium sp.]
MTPQKATIPTRLSIPILLLSAGAGVAAASLPLKPGTYVLAGQSCRDPALAGVFTYDGKAFSSAHAAGCRSLVRSHSEGVYHVWTACSALGDGSPAKETSALTTYAIRSPTEVEVRQDQEASGSIFRWCGPPQAQKGGQDRQPSSRANGPQ